jgi:1,4-dihydroxy-2-naphthoyl-CoA synthase
MASPMIAVKVDTQQSPAPEFDNVLYEKRSGIAYVTLNRPKVLNALNTPTGETFARPSKMRETTPRCAASS